MVDLSNFPYPAYEPNKIVAGFFATIIGILLILWIIQSIQSQFRPRRVIILLLISRLTLFIELILRATLSLDTRNTRAAFTTTTVLLTLSQRMIILANYDFLTQTGTLDSRVSRAIIMGSGLATITSTILMIPAGILSRNMNTIETSFQLRQASAAIVLIMAILFYPIWYLTKTTKLMTKQAILVLFISSITSLIVTIYLMIISCPYYYVAAHRQEFWFYIFHFTPIAIALLVWTILPPKRTLVLTTQPQEDIKIDISDNL
ncbi:unnamed protein product [Adineta steineri]|uniref:Uncharacterized protein n=1 Tax=Adineta steineri TaxID=433720 RepID=A0A813TXI8_9BILA|nr:unnamed protein product [Adineta steineri]CAF0850744.1 unnamed protein product [Adineta steineri]CAF3637834.1 unnamed protein product [Adineta steineri]CAF3884322.1 unnamed protein product [Adineta steineri]